MRNKVVTAEEAVALLRSGDTLATAGFVGIGTPDHLLAALAARHASRGEPDGLTLIFAAGQGDGGERGLNRLAAPGLLKRVIGGHWGLIPKIGRLAIDGAIEAYNLPQGCISRLYREIAAGGPGIVTKVGLGTFVDPLQGGGRINDRTTEDLVERITLKGEDWLFYPAMPINAAFIRATTADLNGNLTAEREALTLDGLAMAMAAKNSGGIVVAQVERVAENHSLNPRQVTVPGILVDCVVIAEPEMHAQTYRTRYSPAYAHEIRVPMTQLAPPPLDARKIIARRAAVELPPGGVVNLGIGMPEGVAGVAAEEQVLRYVTLTAEPGVIGGLPASGLDFGAAVNTDALIDQNQQFDFYDGGGLDLAVLGMAEADRAGNVNVSRFGDRLAGAGGFIDISQNARHVVFVGTFTAGGLALGIGDGRLTIRQEGRARKFVRQVQQITFSGAEARARGQRVTYVTERCVFELRADGPVLTEIAPGLDLERDVLARMDFRPVVDGPRVMDSRLFGTGPMNLADSLFDLRLDQRIDHDPATGNLFLNFAGLRIRSEADIALIEEAVSARCTAIGHPVSAVVNYDHFDVSDELVDAYATMADRMTKRYYSDIRRYTTSAFLRLKLGHALEERGAAAHIFEGMAAR